MFAGRGEERGAIARIFLAEPDRGHGLISPASALRRSLSGFARKSSPSSHSRSKAYRTAASAPWRVNADCSAAKLDFPFSSSDHGLAVYNRRPGFDAGQGGGDRGESSGPIEPSSGADRSRSAFDIGGDAITVPFDLVNPGGAFRRLIDEGRDAKGPGKPALRLRRRASRLGRNASSWHELRRCADTILWIMGSTQTNCPRV